jgi:hypothetical protein
MTKLELERRCAEMRARHAGPQERVVQTKIVAPMRAVGRGALPLPSGHASDFHIDRPHPLVRATRAGRRDAFVDSYNLLHFAGPGRLDLRVSLAALPRALWIMDRFLKRFQAEGIQVESQGLSTTARVDGADVAIRVRESVHRTVKVTSGPEYSYNRYSYVPSGVLTFHLLNEWGSAKKYSDSVRSHLEDQLDSVLTGVRNECKRIKRAEEQRLAWEVINRFEARVEAARDRERSEMRQRIESLLSDVDCWDKSQRIRLYLAAFRDTLERWAGPIDTEGEVGKWLAWALRYADSIDPLRPDV